MKRTFIVIEGKKTELEDAYSLDNITPNMRIEYNDKIYTVMKYVPQLSLVGNQLFTVINIYLE